jgi:uncharacterized coiled-coil protein SlyX
MQDITEYRLTMLEQKSSSYEKDIGEIKVLLARIDSTLKERENSRAFGERLLFFLLGIVGTIAAKLIIPH